MGKKKKFPKGKSVALADFFGMHHDPAVDTGYASDDEREENRACETERDRQKALSRDAVTHGQRKAQTAVLLGEENDYRTNLTAIEKATRANLEETISEECISEECIEREWIELSIAIRKEREHAERAKKAPFIQFGIQEMLNRGNIVDKETEKRISFFNSATTSVNKAKEAEKVRVAQEKLAADRKKAAERAKAFEERTRKASADKKPSLFELVDLPSADEAKAPETNSWLPKWFSKS